MLAPMRVKIDPFRSRPDRCERGLFNRLGRANKRHYRPVVISVAAGVQHMHRRRRTQRFDDSLDDLRATTFAEVGYTFDQWSRHDSLMLESLQE
jgi:hypothetical protein